MLRVGGVTSSIDADGVAMSRKRTYPPDLTDARWALVEPLLPPTGVGRLDRPSNSPVSLIQFMRHRPSDLWSLGSSRLCQVALHASQASEAAVSLTTPAAQIGELLHYDPRTVRRRAAPAGLPASGRARPCPAGPPEGADDRADLAASWAA